MTNLEQRLNDCITWFLGESCDIVIDIEEEQGNVDLQIWISNSEFLFLPTNVIHYLLGLHRLREQYLSIKDFLFISLIQSIYNKAETSVEPDGYNMVEIMEKSIYSILYQQIDKYLKKEIEVFNY